MHYPTLVNISSGVQLIEPPAIEGYVSRLRHRNENQRERLYLGTVGSALVIFKASRAKPPPFPHVGETHHRDEHHEDSEAFQEIRSATARHSQPEVVKEHVKSENTRLHNMLVRCKGVIRLRDVISVELDDSCQHCRRGAAVSEKKLAATLKTGDHEHIIVQLNLSDDRQFRFEVRFVNPGKNGFLLTKPISSRPHRKKLQKSGLEGSVVWLTTGRRENKMMHRSKLL